MKFSVIVPARFASRRLPGKPLLDIGGKPMIWHTWQRAIDSGADRSVIATDDPRIEQAAADFGAEVIMTGEHHRSGTDRVAEAAVQMGLGDDEIIVNLQGDEPMMPPGLIRQAAGDGAQLVVLPECFNLLTHLEEMVARAEPIPGPTSNAMSSQAAELGIHLLAGTICEASGSPGKGYNTHLLSLLMGDAGNVTAVWHWYGTDVFGPDYNHRPAVEKRAVALGLGNGG